MKLITELTEQVAFSKQEDGALYIEGIFAQADLKNRNKRIYPKSVLEKSVAEYVRDYVIDSVEPERLYSEMTDELFERDYSTIGERINKYRVEHGQHRRKNLKKRKRIYKG